MQVMCHSLGKHPVSRKPFILEPLRGRGDAASSGTLPASDGSSTLSLVPGKFVLAGKDGKRSPGGGAPIAGRTSPGAEARTALGITRADF